MYSTILLGIFGVLLVNAGSCRARNFDRTGLAPLSIVYTVYPYYNSETSLLGIWKPVEPSSHPDNVLAPGGAPEKQEDREASVTNLNDESSSDTDSQESSHDRSQQSVRSHDQRAAEITYWPPIQRGALPKPTNGISRTIFSNLDESD